jgi:hypothetical protein
VGFLDVKKLMSLMSSSRQFLLLTNTVRVCDPTEQQSTRSKPRYGLHFLIVLGFSGHLKLKIVI